MNISQLSGNGNTNSSKLPDLSVAETSMPNSKDDYSKQQKMATTATQHPILGQILSNYQSKGSRKSALNFNSVKNNATYKSLVPLASQNSISKKVDVVACLDGEN